MDRSNYWRVLVFFILGTTITLAQNKTIRGTVTDQNGLPLPGVNVIVQGTSNGTQTDFDGNYTIQGNNGQTLVFSYLGQKTVTRPIGESNVIDIQMVEDAEALEEVIVTGQGSGIQKRKLSTTVDVLTEEDIDKLPSNQIDAMLQASTPSAQIRLSSGQPGTASIIRTRGPISAATSSTPVIIVDGVRVDNLNSSPQLGLGTGGANVSALADIPVESIERIEYIKGGAATTLYGADAANGVIQVITKKGREGRATAFFESSLGVIKGTEDYLKYKRTAEALFSTGLSQEFKVGFNGGGKGFSYNFGGSLYKDDSFNNLNEQVKRSFTFGYKAKLSEKMDYQGSFSYTGFESNLDFNANFTTLSRFSGFESAGRGNLDELTDEEWQAELERSDRINPLVDNTQTINRITGSNKFTYTFSNAIQANATVGIDYRTSVSEQIQSNSFQVATGTIPEGTTDQAILGRLLRNAFTVTADLNFTHKANLNDFSFVTILGGQFFRSTDRQNQINGTGGVDGTRSVNNFATQTVLDFVLENANYGLYFLENVGFFNVAFLELGGRLDRNTSAGENTNPLFLPKIGVVYNLSDHDFYKRNGINDIVSTIKLRANYGEATNFAQPFSQDRTFSLNSFLGAPSFTFANPGNPDLVSERVKTTEFGLELGFFGNRLNLSGTRYDATTEDALFTPVSPPSDGQLNQIQNIGEVSNKGWEFALDATLIQTKKHRLGINLSYNTNENVVVSSGGGAPFVVGGFQVIGSVVEEGQSLGYLRGTAAVLQSDGSYEFQPNSNLGDTFAPYFGSIGLNYTWGSFNLFATGDYQFGGKITDLSFLLRNLREFDSEGIPEELNGNTSPFNYVNFFVFDNDFIKIRTIGATYDFGNVVKPFSNIRFGLTVTNPFNWTAGNFDPENTGSGIALQNGFASGGFAYGTESLPRIFLSSLRFQF